MKYFVKEKNERDEIINFHNEINLSNIFFSYDDKKNIFENLNVKIKKNTCVGIKGLMEQVKVLCRLNFWPFEACVG